MPLSSLNTLFRGIILSCIFWRNTCQLSELCNYIYHFSHHYIPAQWGWGWWWWSDLFVFEKCLSEFTIFLLLHELGSAIAKKVGVKTYKNSSHWALRTLSPPLFKIDQNLEKMGWNNSPVKVKVEFSLTAGSGSHNIYCLLSQCHHKQQGYFSGCKSLLTNGDVLQWSACASICVRIVLFKKHFQFSNHSYRK